MSAKAYPELDRLARETYVIDQFICGLNASEIRKHIQFRHPKSVDEAITLAIEYEAFEHLRKLELFSENLFQMRTKFMLIVS